MKTPRFLLDTNILSDLVRFPRGAVAGRIEKVGEDAVCTSIIVACELRFGAAKRESSRLTAQIESILAALEVLPFNAPADYAYAQLRLGLERAGTPIGPNDMLIAAHALSAECVLVTANLGEFSCVAGLSVTNWLETQGKA
jgi:tRNA(fMet)-specific endonuclease VapC